MDSSSRLVGCIMKLVIRVFSRITSCFGRIKISRCADNARMSYLWKNNSEISTDAPMLHATNVTLTKSNWITDNGNLKLVEPQLSWAQSKLKRSNIHGLEI